MSHLSNAAGAIAAGLLAHLHDTMFAGVEQGREMGLYGPEVSAMVSRAR